MSDFTDSSGASVRLSNAERDRAVAALQTHAADGRLTDAELQTRSLAARAAVTRGDLAPLFADLPGFVDFDGSPTVGAARSGNAYTSDPYGTGAGAYGAPGRDRGTFGRNGYIIVSIVPFIALILFFLTSWIWGFAYSWLWFLLIPIVGVIVYGGGYERRDRNRDRNRDR